MQLVNKGMEKIIFIENVGVMEGQNSTRIACHYYQDLHFFLYVFHSLLWNISTSKMI